MICIKNGKKYMKVAEDVADRKVKEGWSYCPRSEFKKALKTGKENCQIIPKPTQTAYSAPKRVKKPKKQEEPIDTMVK